MALTWTGGGTTLTASQVTYISSSQLSISIKLGAAADNWTVKATNPDGKSSSAVGFQVVAPAAASPSISSVSPNPITANADNGLQTITINGSNFVNKPRITLTWTDQPAYALPAERVTFISANQLTISIRLGAAADTWTVKATNPNGQASLPISFQVNAPSGTGNTVLRSAVINTAKSYAEYQWVCSSANVNPGYNDFQAGVTYTGVAYNWGGFDAVSSFQTKMSTGVKAGDSKKCVDGIADTTWGGVDCSGFISRCWNTARKYSTLDIPTICTQILWTELKPGDVLNSSKNTPNGVGHVRLFDKFDTGNSDLLWVYESTTPPSVSSGRVVYRSVSISAMKNSGYLPQRYSLITDDNVTDLTPPVISTFSVSPTSVTFGNSFAISYTVSDSGGSGLKRVELWRANINGLATDSSWVQIGNAISLSGNGPLSGSFPVDAPAAVGNYWYGL